MTDYEKNKKVLDDIRVKYGCQGEIIFKTAIRQMIETGQELLGNEDEVAKCELEIDKKHDKAEAKGKHLWLTRDFEKAILYCAVELAKVAPVYIILYMQKEWLFGDWNEIPYDRAIQLLKNTIEYSLQDRETDIAKEDLEYIGFDDSEIEFLGYGEIFFEEDEE